MAVSGLNVQQQYHSKRFPGRIFITDGGGSDGEAIDQSDMDITDMNGVEDHLLQWPDEAVGVYELVGFARLRTPKIDIIAIEKPKRIGRPKGSRNKTKAVAK